MRTLKVEKYPFILLYTLDAVGNGNGYTAQYCVTFNILESCSLSGERSEESHIIRTGRCSANRGDGPTEVSLNQILDDAIKDFNRNKGE